MQFQDIDLLIDFVINIFYYEEKFAFLINFTVKNK